MGGDWSLGKLWLYKHYTFKSIIRLFLLDERQSRSDSFSVLLVVREEGAQTALLARDTRAEEAPQDDGEDAAGDGVAQQDLRAKRPVEESYVRWVTRVAVRRVIEVSE